MAMSDWQRYPEKLCLIKYELYIIFLVLKTDFSQLWFVWLRIYTAGKRMGIIIIKHSKPDNTFHIFDQIKCQGCRCESGIANLYMGGHLNLHLQSL